MTRQFCVYWGGDMGAEGQRVVVARDVPQAVTLATGASGTSLPHAVARGMWVVTYSEGGWPHWAVVTSPNFEPLSLERNDD